MRILRYFLINPDEVKKRNGHDKVDEASVHHKAFASSDMVQENVSANEFREENLKQLKKYYGNPPKVVKGEDIPSHEEKFDWAIAQDKPKDWAFMEQSGETLRHLPPTWMQYPNTQEGIIKIIEMEYGEVMAAWKDKMGTEAVSHELVHLASACLHLWRRLNHAE